MIYLASPYTTTDKHLKETRLKNLKNICSILLNAKYNIISPVLHNAYLFEEVKILDSSWDFWKLYCLDILSKCNELFVFKDIQWESSIGVNEEIRFAKQNGIPIKYLTLNDDKIIFE